MALNIAVEDTGEGHQFADALTLTPEAKKSMDERISEVYFYVVNRGGPKSLRGRIAMVLLSVPDVLQDDTLYEEYFGGCGQGDPRRQGIQLGKERCLWATRKHTISVGITSDKMDRRLYNNPKLRGCQP